MDFTREPIIETIITPQEGHKLVVRSSAHASQTEYFVDAVEIVAFGSVLFFRSLERPKVFLVPVSDYEILEVRETRMVLKNAELDRSIKIGGGREAVIKASREVEKEETEESLQETAKEKAEVAAPAEERVEARVDKKRDRRRQYRKRRGREEKEEEVSEGAIESSLSATEGKKPSEVSSETALKGEAEKLEQIPQPLFSPLLQPPSTLISDSINRYRNNEMFKKAFYLTDEEQYKPHDKVQELLNEDDESIALNLQEPSFVPETSAPITNDQEKKEKRKIRSRQKTEERGSFSYQSEEDDEIRNMLPLYVREETASEDLSERIIESPSLEESTDEDNPP